LINEGTADADTLFAYTNHSYFNCDQSTDAMHHVLTIQRMNMHRPMTMA
jgi:galactose mutarotase-like enzyme